MANGKKPSPEILERINRGILLRTGAYLTNDHFVLSPGRHAKEYVEKTLVTTEPAFSEGLGEIIAAHFGGTPVDLVITTGHGAAVLGHCVARAHPSRPRFVYAVKVKGGGRRGEVVLPREFDPFVTEGARALIVEDILTTGETVRRLVDLVESRAGRVVGVGAVWRRSKKIKFRQPTFILVDREFPSYAAQDCPLCKNGVPVNTKYGVTGPDGEEDEG